MKTYTLKSVIRRGSIFAAAFAIVIAAIAPAASTYADALNPLTDRSLTLSSSSPGWDFKDGSGNETYAQPNSGANGQKTGNTFAFKVSTDSSTDPLKLVKGFSFQYCTKSAGLCKAPGNIAYDTTGGAGAYTRGSNGPTAIAAKQSDLDVVTTTPSEATSAIGTYVNATSGNVTSIPAATATGQNFIVLKKDIGDTVWTQSTGWAMDTINEESDTVANGEGTGKNNYIRLVNAAGGLDLQTGADVKIVFFATNTNYITNPGEGAFFVKINDYNTATAASFNDSTLLDGGVTVANVMNRSIQIQTKVLETMDFSVGTVDPYTLSNAQLSAATAGNITTHGQCDRILPSMLPSDPGNALLLGDTSSENSLATDRTYSTHSYWRLSSNSSAGATVYYSGVTLKNTVEDEIKAIGTSAAAPQRGTEQFGLALANGTRADNGLVGGAGNTYAVNYGKETTPDDSGDFGVFENGADNATAGIHASVATDISTAGLGAAYHSPQLYPLIPEPAYDNGAGVVNGPQYGTVNTSFAFDTASNLVPAAIATESDSVVDCVTAKMRYIANIAATTPAGIYTTKINYIAAPQY